MEKSNKRGKIPQQDWPSIMARYDAGETLASIARTYDCSPPAISYIVSRSRARSANNDSPSPAPAAVEPQLVKSHQTEAQAPAEAEVKAPEPVAAEASAAPASAAHVDEGTLRHRPGGGDSRFEARAHEGNGAAMRFAMPERDLNRSGTMQNGSGGRFSEAARPLLHLSSGAAERNRAERPAGLPPAQHAAPRPDPERPSPEPARGSMQSQGDSAKRDIGTGNFIDATLRARVDGDIAAFLAAFDAALAADSLESRAGLREATDRLLRAGARTRIELERLEARVPLPPRDNTAHHGPSWRHR